MIKLFKYFYNNWDYKKEKVEDVGYDYQLYYNRILLNQLKPLMVYNLFSDKKGFPLGRKVRPFLKKVRYFILVNLYNKKNLKFGRRKTFITFRRYESV